MTDISQVNTVFQLLSLAKRRISPGAWDYMMGGSETETTLNQNRLALDRLAFRPRVLRNVEHVDTSTTLLGQKLKLPIVLAPIGSMQDIIAEGGVVPTRAAARAGVVHMLSSVCAPGLEEVSRAADHPKFFQLYVRGDKAWVDSTIKRALEFGYRAICLTVDRAAYGRRERDLAKGHRPTARVGHAPEAFQAAFDWDDVDRIRSFVNVPLIIKGISTAEDAEIGVARGVDCIYVSNHGGRQLDHSVGTIAALPEIVAAVDGRAEIIVDGGILRGTDVLKALALGATAVGVGRLQGIALGAGGEDAVVRMLEIIANEIAGSMALLGVTKLSELNPRYLTSAEPIARTWIESAFPLMREGYGAPANEIRELSLALPGEVAGPRAQASKS
ncbi:MAG TPA: alpha-hydroxy acid oxidase [Pseudolabrys sp.]|nr:alpha-hydroxy acid oxidase [Pseudolabrys sp.]